MKAHYLWLILLLLLTGEDARSSHERGDSAEDDEWTLATVEAYRAPAGACYVPVKINPDVYLDSDEFAACVAILDNLNRFCDEPPQYERRRLHPSTANLQEPDWEAVDVLSNLELIRKVYGAISLAEYRESRWEHEKTKVLSLARSGALRLARAGIRANFWDGEISAFMLENSQLGDPLGYNQPRLMFADPSTEEPLDAFENVTYEGVADLWLFQGEWYLIRYEVDYDHFVVDHFIRPSSSRVGVPEVCTFKYVEPSSRENQ